ncbi:TIGR03085 family protein [Brachybacterium sp. MASK1Z-5]|uniref:TIGR03085 family protein n=1 Tax=Brachybacterium halotolerans TaxID=2795215 RepID=A0ABS1B5S8_9MICO|nr:TIGR03085 family metal-binding protein [Brachybacterium halotolerans]MBK0329991.1 TIGR03085 family protein [Brachybacterium halotolerans]
MSPHSEPLARHERAALADDLVSFGPDAPTVIDEWDASALLEHLILREQRQDLMIGPKLPVGPIADRSYAALRRLQERTWADRVEMLRSGPPRFSPFRLVDSLANTIEYLVHHEDLLRARPGWEPRTLSEAHDQELWTHLKRMARPLVRTDVDVTLVSPLGGVRVPSKDPIGSVRVHGSPTELTLWAFGRDRVSRVRIEGDPEALLVLRRGDRGF